jgi:hypothetical protein
MSMVISDFFFKKKTKMREYNKEKKRGRVVCIVGNKGKRNVYSSLDTKPFSTDIKDIFNI